MNLQLVYPNRLEGHKKEDLQGIPNKHNEFSGYYLLAVAESQSVIPEKYACFTDSSMGQVWIEKIATVTSKKWFTIEDTRRVDDDEEFDKVLNFLKEKKILD